MTTAHNNSSGNLAGNPDRALSRLRYYGRIYRMLFAQFLKSRMEYRADFIISVIGMAIRQIAGIFGLWVIFQSISAIDGWGIHELIFIYGFAQMVAVPQQTCLENLWQFGWTLREGSFIKYYMRPLNTLFYFASDVFDIKGVGQLLLGAIAMVYANSQLDIQWSLASAAWLAVAYLCASVTLMAVMLISGTTGFWTYSSNAVMLFSERLKGYAHYPMGIFGSGLRFTLSYLIPLGFLAFYPMQILLRPDEPHLPRLLFPLVALIFAAIAVSFWNQGVRRYEGTGS